MLTVPEYNYQASRGGNSPLAVKAVDRSYRTGPGISPCPLLVESAYGSSEPRAHGLAGSCLLRRGIPKTRAGGNPRPCPALAVKGAPVKGGGNFRAWAGGRGENFPPQWVSPVPPGISLPRLLRRGNFRKNNFF
jgi:hypothetical protein